MVLALGSQWGEVWAEERAPETVQVWVLALDPSLEQELVLVSDQALVLLSALV